MVDIARVPDLHQELFEHVCQRTGRRVRDLAVEVRPNRVVLTGRTATYHVKQLAQHGVRDLLPDIELCNAIVVDG